MHVGYLTASLMSSNCTPVAPPLGLTTKNVSRCCQMSPGEQNHSLLRTAAVQTGVGKFVSVNGQTVSILDFVGHTWSLSHLFLP